MFSFFERKEFNAKIPSFAPSDIKIELSRRQITKAQREKGLISMEAKVEGGARIGKNR